MRTARIIGAGAFLPARVVDNARISAAIPGWTGQEIEEKTGIRERRSLWDLDVAAGRAIVPPDDVWPRTNTDICEAALRQALDAAGIPAAELDGLWLVTVSPDQLNFCHDAISLHHRFGCRRDAYAFMLDSGCGGALYVMDVVRRQIESGTHKTIAVIASNLTSAYVDRDVFTSEVEVNGRKLNACLTMYLFGDGAGAVILTADAAGSSGIVSSYSGTDYSELVIRRGGGAMRPPHQGRSANADHAYIVNGQLVAKCFPAYMRECMQAAIQSAPPDTDIARYYLHQANKRLVEKFVSDSGLPPDRVAMHMDRYGNTSAAGTLILLAEDIANQRVSLGSGEAVLFAAIGAGVHYAAHIVRL